jgi:sulfonate transport system ATP-binding protein
MGATEFSTWTEAPSKGTKKLSLAGVSRSFPNGRGRLSALEDINLDVREGEFVSIVGPSGCGKSTLLNLIAGLDRPDQGEVRMNGDLVAGPSLERVVLFQEHALFPWLTVLENIEFGLRMKGIAHGKRREQARRYLRLVNLCSFESSYSHQLSGGMKQRVALARSLAVEPSVLLMDEPFAALDAQARDQLHDELERVWAETGKTIIFVTHNVREAVRLGDRIVLMTYRPGRIKSEHPISLPRPRHIEDREVAAQASEVRDLLCDEVQKAVEVEFHHETQS